MKKDLQKNQGQKLTLKLNKETLRLLESSELLQVEGAGSNNSVCLATLACCQLN